MKVTKNIFSRISCHNFLERFFTLNCFWGNLKEICGRYNENSMPKTVM